MPKVWLADGPSELARFASTAVIAVARLLSAQLAGVRGRALAKFNHA